MKTVLFDFDGTIADSMTLVRDISDEIMQTLDREPLTDSDVEKIRKMTVAQGFKYLKVPIRKLPQLILQARSIMKEKIDSLPPIDGITEVLRALKQDYRLAIVTSNSLDNVEIFLNNHQMDDLFDFVEAGAGAFNKSRRLKQAMKKHDVDVTKAIYVGDEIRDVQAAQAVGLPVIAVGWGMNHTEVLEDEKPSLLVSSVDQLQAAVRQLL